MLLLNNYKLCITLFFVFFISTSCEELEKRKAQERERLIDSISTKKIHYLRPVMDSICRMHFDSLLTEAVDSILDLRLKEIEEKLRNH